MAAVWRNELTHDHTPVDPKSTATYWRMIDRTGTRQAEKPAVDARTLARDWESLPLWTALDECDSGWHRPTTVGGRDGHGERVEKHKGACPYCGMSAKEDLARRRKLGKEHLTEAEQGG